MTVVYDMKKAEKERRKLSDMLRIIIDDEVIKRRDK